VEVTRQQFRFEKPLSRQANDPYKEPFVTQPHKHE